MLPLIKLNAGELFSLETLPAAESLMPEGASALDGEFAGVLRANVAPLVLPAADTGELLPLTGNALPQASLLPAPALPITVETRNLPAVEVPEVEINAGEVAPADNSLAQMLSGLVRREPNDVNPDSLAVPGLPAKDLDVQHTPPLPAVATDEIIRSRRGDTILQGDLRQDMRESAGLDQLAIAGAPVSATNLPDAEPLERNHSHGDRRPPATLVQQVQLPYALTATGDEAPLPVTQNAVSIRPQVATDLRQSRERTTIASDAPITTLATERPTVTRDESQLMLRPVATNVAQTPLPADMPPAIDSSARFSGEITAALSRQPQTGTLPTISQAIELPVQQQGWDNSLAERVTLMANAKLQNAEIRLTPAELGPLKIQLVVEDGTANITFHSQHLTTRDAIEQALPRLREMLAENGLSLGQANVNDESMEQRERQAQSGGRANAQTGDEQTPADDASSSHPASRRLDGLVDTFV